jgi:hypothetical protein
MADNYINLNLANHRLNQSAVDQGIPAEDISNDVRLSPIDDIPEEHVLRIAHWLIVLTWHLQGPRQSSHPRQQRHLGPIAS